MNTNESQCECCICRKDRRESELAARMCDAEMRGINMRMKFLRDQQNAINFPISSVAEPEFREAQKGRNEWMSQALSNINRSEHEDYPPVMQPLLKLILRQMAYFLFLMLLIAFGWAVFS